MKKFSYIYGQNIEHEYPNVSMAIERIEPETAKLMLKTNVRNRTLKKQPIGQALQNGEWLLNGATICFSETGVLLDGQHRLYECVNTGIAIETIVVRGLKDNTQITMDVGVKRQLSDRLKLDGYAQSTVVAAIGSAIYRAETLGIDAVFSYSTGQTSITMQSYYQFIVSEYEARIKPLVDECKKVSSAYKVATTITGPLFDIFRRLDEEDYQLFVKQLRGQKPPSQPVNKLREFYWKNMGRNTKYNNRYLAAVMVKAWNAYVSGDEIGLLVFRPGGAHPEDFPEILSSHYEEAPDD